MWSAKVEPVAAGVVGGGNAEHHGVEVAQLHAASAAGVAEHLADRRHRVLGTGEVGGRGHLAQHVPGEVGDGGGQPVLVDVHGRDEGGALVEAVQLGVGARGAGGGAARHDQSALGQALQELGRRGLGETRQAGQLCAGERAVLQQQLEGDPVVDGAHRARRGARDVDLVACGGHLLRETMWSSYRRRGRTTRRSMRNRNRQLCCVLPLDRRISARNPRLGRTESLRSTARPAGNKLNRHVDDGVSAR